MRPFAAAALLVLFPGSGCDFSFSLSVVSDDGLPSASADVISDPATDGSVRQDGAGVTTSAIHFGDALSFSAFSAAGAPVRGFLSGVRLVPFPGTQRVLGDVVPELQADVDDPFLRFFQFRLTGTGGGAQIVDGGGNRAGGAPPGRTLCPVLSVLSRW